MDLSSNPVEARRSVRQLINDIARENTLNGAIFGTHLEVLVNNCLDM
jgi:hypothetical protein